MTPDLIDLVHDDLTAAVAELRDVADTLSAARRRTDLVVDVLLDGGWSGRAADAYRDGCDRVVAALAAMAELVARAHADQVSTDEQSAAALRSLAGGSA